MDEQPVETTLYSLEESPPGPTQRRTSERHLTLFRVGSLTIDGRRELCLIKNVSAGGMMVRAYSPIAEGSALSVELKQGEPLSGVARWVKDDYVGVSFDSPIDVLKLVSNSMEGPRPRMPRVEVQSTAWVRDGASVHRSRALNISQGGVRIRCAQDISIGAEVVVTMTGMAPVPAVCRWKDGDSYGLSFHRPLGLPVLMAWLLQQQQQQQRQNATSAAG